MVPLIGWLRFCRSHYLTLAAFLRSVHSSVQWQFRFLTQNQQNGIPLATGGGESALVQFYSLSPPSLLHPPRLCVLLLDSESLGD